MRYERPGGINAGDMRSYVAEFDFGMACSGIKRRYCERVDVGELLWKCVFGIVLGIGLTRLVLFTY